MTLEERARELVERLVDDSYYWDDAEKVAVEALQSVHESADREGYARGQREERERRQAEEVEKTMQILTNMGVDVTCGACMSVAMAGAALGYKHTCGHIRKAEP